MSVERFWNIALFDKDAGYYTTGTPIGAGGDFTTAPEISQMFGELVGAWLVAAWREVGCPSPFLLAEFGPGRGTLMADILRTVMRLDLDFAKAMRVRLVETSPRLSAMQAERLAPFDLPLRHVERLGQLEPLPLLLVANELFDAVAIRQYRFDGANWRERLVGLDADGALAFVDGPASQPVGLPDKAPTKGAIFESAPLREALAAEIGSHVTSHGGAVLVFDYGHARSGFGDTLQALRGHAFAPVLADPGRQDITSHVDFERLGAVLGAAGAAVSPAMEQGALLFALGLAERAKALARKGDPASVEAAARRLAGTGAGEMGALFRAIACASRPLALPPFAVATALD